MEQQHWQLQIAAKSLKKQEKIREIQKFIGPLNDKRCLEIGCDKGVLSYHLRQWGGDWVSVDADAENLRITRELVKTNVEFTDGKTLNFPAQHFDLVLAVDFLEHIHTDQEFLGEICRVLKNDGMLYITVPHTARGLILNAVRRWIGFKPEDYGHVREGYALNDLQEKLDKAGLQIRESTTFSRFVSEALELALNFGYFFVLSRKQHRGGIKGGISPNSSSEAARHANALRLYAFIYPIMKTLAYFDQLLFFTQGYILMVSAKKR